MKAVSLRAGLSESGLRDVLSRGVSPSIDTFVRISETLGVSPIWLLQGDEQFRLNVPVAGVIRDADVWHPAGGELSRFDLDAATQELICIRVEGDGMSPVYRRGDEIFCSRHSGTYIDNFIGLDCVVQTADGQRLIRILARGSKPGLFNLRSFNPLVKDVENVAIAWAAPVQMIKRGSREG